MDRDKLTMWFYLIHGLGPVVFFIIFGIGFFLYPNILYILQVSPIPLLIVIDIVLLMKIKRLWFMHLILGWALSILSVLTSMTVFVLIFAIEAAEFL
ncbi:hypothetical protein D3H55_06360 [Bacillus salacetis]|uniref:Uncharacterized protein n=1 Tax=Bacillus salacetis TaxID=2315464 RepID=A0A3A1R2E2_9BACI|nr:hypothetical protein D3H55_06360 [Bacillus salacetis]